ncbi:MAG: 6-pyruvoyl trahydropterin synthase family protein [Pseudonocardiaceae bacterium]
MGDVAHGGASSGPRSLGTVPASTPGRFTIRKAWEINGVSHELRLMPDGHKCRRNHGHNYVVTVEVAADSVDHYGMVIDFGDLEPFHRYMKDTFDHSLLNEHLDFHPTSELFAFHLGCWFIENLEPHLNGRLAKVEVAETRLSSATWNRIEES